jgi:hypothetical protein
LALMGFDAWSAPPQQVEAQHEAAFPLLTLRAASPYFSRTVSFRSPALTEPPINKC